MSVVFQAIDEPATTRAEYWRHVLDHSLVPMDVRLDDGPTARDKIVTGSVGAVRVVESSSGPGEARRIPRHIRQSDPGLYQLFVQDHGSAQASQGGRWATLAPGDLSLTDLSRPFHCVHPSRTAILLSFPKALLPLPDRDLAKVMGTRVPGNSGTGALASTLARQLPHHLDDHTAADAARLGTTVLDLLTVALGARLDRADAVPPESHRRALLQHIHAFIEARLSDPELNPTTVADAHYISVRYLHKLFQTEQVTVADHIRRRRLDRCRRDLLDPTLAKRPVSAIAARWGFVNPAHFTRAFRDTYGLTPREYRLIRNGHTKPLQP